MKDRPPASPQSEALTDALKAGAMEAFEARWRHFGNHLSRAPDWDIEQRRAWFLDGWAHALALPQVAGAPVSQAWISVEERLPEIGVEVLTYRPNNDRRPVTVMSRRIAYEESLDYYWDAPTGGNATLGRFVTHWMPLPAPPPHEAKGELR